MSHNSVSLDELFREHEREGKALVLATVVHTIGSTYRKAGAQMLISPDGRAAGLLSGGCLESDLVERARAVLDDGRAQIADYDSRSSDDILWGMGLGCEGAMRILLSRLDRRTSYQPYAFHARCRELDRPGRSVLVVESENPRLPLGAAFTSDEPADAPEAVRALFMADSHDRAAQVVTIVADGAKFLVAPVALPLRLLVLGAGPDAAPLVEIAGLMGWNITVRDHRAAYAVPERFPRARQVLLRAAKELSEDLQRAQYDAAVVMSHHLPSDEIYLDALADSKVPYIGLLGPAPRRVRLMHEIGAKAKMLEGRLHGPVGLDIGASTPEGIALAIISEIQAVSAGRDGGSFSRKVVS